MEIALILLGLLALGSIFYAVHLHRQSQVLSQQESNHFQQQFQQTLTGVMQQLNAISTRVDERLKENNSLNQRTHQSIGERLDNAAKVINSVTNKLASLEESNKKIYDVGKDIVSLQEILRAPKLRGNLGEFFLGDLLAQIFPQENFSLQYKFKTGSIVDAVIHLRDGFMVPVDAKFPLENFKKLLVSEEENAIKKSKKLFISDVQKHIDTIATRYILTDEGTLDFALMYVPAENVYYEMIIKEQDEKSISQYALSKRVIPVSPNSFYIYLQAILMGLRGFQIEKSAKEILSTLGRLKSDFQSFNQDFALVGTHLQRAQNSYLSSEKRLGRFQEKLEVIEAKKEETPILESPGELLIQE